MKKKEYPNLFPKLDTYGTPKEPINKPYFLKLGAVFRIGMPANQSYLYIQESMTSKKSNLNVLHPKKLFNQIVVATGILELSNSKQKAILERRDKTDFYTGLRRIYVDINDAIIAKEVIPL